MYLYIFIDGTTVQRVTSPHKQDLDSIDEGELTVIYFDGKIFRSFDGNGNSQPIQEIK